MKKKSFNSYEDAGLAAAYARLEFPGTYYLAFRDLPDLITRNVSGRRALDFGCGAGRSTRFLRGLGFRVTGIDISAEMIGLAREVDPGGDYRLIPDGDFGSLREGEYHLILSAFTFDNIPTREKKEKIIGGLCRLLRTEGRMVNLVSTPDIYTHEWASFSTRDYPQNRTARCGEVVKIVNTSIADSRPVADILWPDRDYRRLYRAVGLEVLSRHLPLADGSEPIAWVNETRIAPWAIYLLRRRDGKAIKRS